MKLVSDLVLSPQVTVVISSGFLYGSRTLNNFKREISETDLNLLLDC